MVARRAAFWPAADPMKVRLLQAPGESGAFGVGDEELIVRYAAGRPYVRKSTVEGGCLPGEGAGSATAIAGDWIVGTSGPSTGTGVVAGVTTGTEPRPPYREATLSTRRLPHLSAARDYDVATAINADGTVIAGEQPSGTITRPIVRRC
ncbi:hypothetical protein ACGFJ7_29995 [Actinoplanes sp. NPDC048988]|uniref:hypothetical protein n=1 Tax=Actinoplanes sp. NPDC048988 TaxID=3363901 RepID=UPI003715D8BA